MSDSYDTICIVMESYKDVQISTMCKSTYPCGHFVILPDGTEQMMSGDKIYKIIPRKHPAYNHFKEYKYWNCKKALRRIQSSISDLFYKRKKAPWTEKHQQEEAANKPSLFNQYLVSFWPITL